MGRSSTRPFVASRPQASDASWRPLVRRAGTPPSTALALLLAGFFTGFSSLLPALALAESEDEVKAAFLFNFARYVEWPDSAFEGESAPIRLCVISEGQFAEVLSGSVSGRQVEQRPVEVVMLDGIEAAQDCHVLFIDESASATAPVVAGRLGGLAVFTISDRAGFAAEGGIANFILVDQKIRFEINPAAARSAGLKISSSLLRLAKLVGEDGR